MLQGRPVHAKVRRMKIDTALLDKLAKNAPSVLSWVAQSPEIDEETCNYIKGLKNER
jgi:hypothetical protein